MTPNQKKKSPIVWLALVLFLIGGLVVGAYILGGAWRNNTPNQPVATKDVYYCPMHPDYKSDKPGDCPICNMALVKKETGGEPHTQSPAPGAIHISPEKQQLIGVRFGVVTQESLSKSIRTVANLAYDESKIVHYHNKVEGWIERVFVNTVGSFVRHGDPLFTIYSPDLVSTQQEYLIALKAKRQLEQSSMPEIAQSTASLYQATLQRLKLWDVSDDQIRRLEQTGEIQRTVTFYSPHNGFVIEKKAFEHLRVTPETELYTFVDLSTIWAIADIYESEASLVKVGQRGTMTLSSFPEKTFRGKVTYISPQLDPSTRTLKVRLEFANPEVRLKPDMFANVVFEMHYGDHLSVPQEAVMDSGTEQIVFVAQEGGYFEPRKVQLGAKVDDRYIILSGLTPGEKVVISGNFLIDSESQLKSALSSMGTPNHASHEGATSDDKQNH